MLRRFTLLALFGTVVTGLNTTDWHHLQWFDLRNFFIPVVSVYAYHLLRTGRTQAASRHQPGRSPVPSPSRYVTTPDNTVAR